MSRPVYSKQFILGDESDSGIAYVVPDDMVAILTDVDTCQVSDEGSQGTALYITGINVWFSEGVTQAGYAVSSWRGRAVVPGGGYIAVTIDGTGGITASGYLLTSS